MISKKVRIFESRFSACPEVTSREYLRDRLYKKREYMCKTKKQNTLKPAKEATGCELKARNMPMRNSALSEWENTRKRRLLVGASCNTRQENSRSTVFFIFYFGKCYFSIQTIISYYLLRFCNKFLYIYIFITIYLSKDVCAWIYFANFLV